MRLASRIIALALCVACVVAFYLGLTQWVLPIAAIACVSFFLGLRSEFVKTRDESLREATEGADSETQA
jgi:heme O synthase-like polyprenyltransferase